MSRKILIVEDAETAAATLEIALENIPGVNVLRVSDGLRAWEYLAPEKGAAIDALVTDLELPFLDGFELIRRVRQQSRFALLPIVVISGLGDPQVSERVKRLGADAFFSKPWSPLEVRKKVECLLNSS
ncbi:MAG: response regulator [Acidobacteria bacterium]|nr:response regulator [Acidobacteriota bacterium]